LTQDNNISGSVTLNNPQIIRDFKFKNISAGAGTIDGLTAATNLRDLTILYPNATGGYDIPSLRMASLQNLSITTGAGPITQATGGIVQSGATASFSAGAYAITLNDPNNEFRGVVDLSNSGVSGVDISIRDSSALRLGTSSVGQGKLTVRAVGITQDAGTSITQASGADEATFDGGAGEITLNGSDNDFTGPVRLNNTGANHVAVNDKNGIQLGASSVGSGTLKVTATGANPITQTGAITQQAKAGAATFTTGAGAITLNDPDNDFTGVLGLNNSGSRRRSGFGKCHRGGGPDHRGWDFHR